MTATTLRTLAKTYAKQGIAAEEYRAARADYISGILSGEIALTVNEYPPILKPKQNAESAEDAKEAMEDTERRPPKKKNNLTNSESVAQEEQAQSPNNRWVILFVIGAIVVIGTLIALLSGNGNSSKTISIDTEPVSNANTQSLPGELSEAKMLIQTFLSNKSWSESKLETFLGEWDALPGTSKSGIESSVEIAQFASAIYKKLLEERALSGLSGDNSNLDKQRKLIDFAKQIGITDPRIALAN